ncbi:hypothetical protein V4V48_003076 [Vibrio mimicus]
MKKVYPLSFMLCALSVSPLTLSAEPSNSPELDTTVATKIEHIVVYSKQGNGDLLVSVKAPSERCAGGYFVEKSSPGYDGIFSLLLAAHQVQSPIILSANPEALWPSSQQSVCELHSVILP